MKKILSLALALLMLFPLAIGTSAATANKITTADDFRNLLDLWQWLNQDEKDKYKDLYDYFCGSDLNYDGLVREWKDYCDNCDKVAFYYVSKGKVYRSCIDCGTKNVTPEIETSGKCGYCHKKDCICVDPGFTIRPELEFNSLISHKYKTCSWFDVDFCTEGNTVYWFCDNCGKFGHFDSPYFAKWFDRYWTYQLSVYCSAGGTYEIDGSKTVKHGDTRTITFEPKYGYVLYNVTVNGEDYGRRSTLDLTVTEDLVIRAEFVKASSLKEYTITATAAGNGTITAKKNNVKVDASAINAKLTDTVTYTFVPGGSRYAVKDVVVDGRSVGAVKSYTFTNGISKDHTIAVTFEWKNPYSDVADNYLKAVEYVTEAGIMGYYNRNISKDAFSGKTEITVKYLASALAEMTDVNNLLSTADDRLAWAIANGLVKESDDLSALCSVQTACEIVDNFLSFLESKTNVNFTKFDSAASAKDNALSIGLVSETTYANNRVLTRYDLASICYLISNLSVK